MKLPPKDVAFILRVRTAVLNESWTDELTTVQVVNALTKNVKACERNRLQKLVDSTFGMGIVFDVFGNPVLPPKDILPALSDDDVAAARTAMAADVRPGDEDIDDDDDGYVDDEADV